MFVYMRHWVSVVCNIACTLVVLALIAAIFLPELFVKNSAAPIARIASVLFVSCCVGAYAEYAIHRHLFHQRRWPFKWVYGMHIKHHLSYEKELEVLPSYWFGMLCLLATPFIALSQWLVPKDPVLLGGYLGVAVSYMAFEVAHLVAHTTDTAFARYHREHHQNWQTNFSAAGFFGLPLDRIFGTRSKR